MSDAPFGTYALPPALDALRRAGGGLGDGGLARRARSAIRRLCLAGRPGPVDVEPFPGQCARLHPADNLSEKRAFQGGWDSAERAALAAAVAAAPAPFHFVDAGANAGLYSLAVRAMGPARILAIEPDAENLRRLRFNLSASAAAEVTVAPVALAAEEGRLTLSAPTANRGEIGAGTGGATVPARPLLVLLVEAGFPRLDALKLDIEGAEAPVLRAFLRDAPTALRPTLVILEAPRGAETPALALLIETGYAVKGRTKLNAILTAPGAARPLAATED